MKVILKEFEDLTKNELEIMKSSNYIAIDTETTGLDPFNDILCTIQIQNDNMAFFCKIKPNGNYFNLEQLLFQSNCIKIFHNAVFDVGFLFSRFRKSNMTNIRCTKISSKLVNGLNYDNTLKGLVKKYLDIDLNKEYRLSNWFATELTNEQIEYAMNDVKYLYTLWSNLELELIEANLINVAHECFEFIPSYIKMQSKGISNIFSY